MKTFKQLLEEFDAVLKEFNPGAYENLAPPLSNAEVVENMKAVNMHDTDVKSIYQWKGGVKKEGGCLMTRFGELLTFESIKESALANDSYDKRLIPLISDNGEQMLLFNTNQGPHYGKLYLYSVSQLYIDYPISCYDSLFAMIKTTIEAYKGNILQYRPGSKRLKIDTPRFAELAIQYNTKSKYWVEHDALHEEEWYEI